MGEGGHTAAAPQVRQSARASAHAIRQSASCAIRARLIRDGCAPSTVVDDEASARRSDAAPDGSDVRVLLAVAGGGLAQFEIGPNETSIAVTHRTVEEVWYILRGLGEMWRRLGQHEEVVELSIGVCLTIPVGTTFQFRSFGFEPLTAIGATIPPWPGEDEAVPTNGIWPPTLGA